MIAFQLFSLKKSPFSRALLFVRHDPLSFLDDDLNGLMVPESHRIGQLARGLLPPVGNHTLP